MSIEWIAPFQQRIKEAQRLITALADGYVPLGKSPTDEARYAQQLLDLINLLASWAAALPLDEEFWSYIMLFELCHRAKTQHSSLLFNLEALQRERVLFTYQDDPLQTLIDAAHASLTNTLKTITTLRQASIIPANAWRSAPHRCPPSVIVYELCLSTYGRELMQLPTAFQMQGWPDVPFHPSLYTTMRNLVGRLWFIRRTSPVYLAVNQLPDFCEISLTTADLHFRPEMWDALIYRPDVTQPELLRSIGYVIEPMVWDRGHGEGLVVRLPWVRV